MTAEGYSAWIILPLGAMIVSGRKHPSFNGISAPIKLRKTYNTTAWQTANGAL